MDNRHVSKWLEQKDEFISFAMEEAYNAETDEELETALKQHGVEK